MSKSYTPGLKILEKTSIKKERILPLKGKVHVNQGDSVNADSIVASTKIPGNVQMVNVANQLNIDPDEILDCMLCSVDEDIKKNQIIAQSKGLFGFFKSEVKSPLDGTIGNISDVTGQVIISEKPYPIEVDAYIPGKINDVIDKEGVIVSSHGMLIQGIIGIGGEKKGYIKTINNEKIRGKKILILGGLGMIGSNLACKLVACDAEVTIVDAFIEPFGANFFNVSRIKEKVNISIT